LALNNTFLESLDFPLFFDIIAVEINAFLHAVPSSLCLNRRTLPPRREGSLKPLLSAPLSGSEMRPTQVFLQFREEMVVT
jgi:hypothetical protein